jgi:UDP-glucose-4-epimerase GalE
LSTGNKSAVKWGPLILGNIANGDLLKSTFKKYKIKAVMHFAADAYIDESIKNPRKYIQNNVIGTINLLNAMLDSGIKYFVFSSSCATYGISKEMPLTENHYCQPINPYGESKLFIENMLKWYSNIYQLNWVALRYFNAAGADPDNEIGENHNPETHIIPLAIYTALGRQLYFNINGTDFATKDGTAIRDYLHVSDIARAHVLAIDYLLSKGKSNIMNLGTGKGHSIYEIIHAVEKFSDKIIPLKKNKRREGDAPILIANAKKAEKILGWHPKYKTIDGIIETAWNWYTKRESNE